MRQYFIELFCSLVYECQGNFLCLYSYIGINGLPLLSKHLCTDTSILCQFYAIHAININNDYILIADVVIKYYHHTSHKLTKLDKKQRMNQRSIRCGWWLSQLLSCSPVIDTPPSYSPSATLSLLLLSFPPPFPLFLSLSEYPMKQNTGLEEGSLLSNLIIKHLIHMEYLYFLNWLSSFSFSHAHDTQDEHVLGTIKW